MLLTLLSPQGAVTSISVTLAASEAKDTAAFAATLRVNAALAASEAKDTAAFATSIRFNMTLIASEAKDIAAFLVSGGGASEQFTVSGPYVTDTFTTTTLSYPYDIKKRTA